MKYDFETLIDRRGTGSYKWNQCADDKEMIAPLSVADVDMKMPPELQEGLIKFLQNDPVLGYTGPTDEYLESVVNWMKNKHNYCIKKDWIIESSGIVPAIHLGVQAFTKENDGVIVMTPVYYPFYGSIEKHNRKIIRCPLILNDTKYTIDFDKFEELASKESTSLFILCNPHNPVGRVFTKEELQRLGDICLKNDVKIISDEIHQDLIMPGFKHIPIASLSEEIANITMTCSAPSKTFNLAGLQGSNIIIKNEELREKFIVQKDKNASGSLNTISYEATKIVYTKCDEWLEQFKDLIYQNYLMAKEYISENLPKAKVIPLQGTYLMWVDLRAYGFDYKALEEKMIKNHLYLDEGYVFGDEGKGFERFNIACPRQVLKDSLVYFVKAIKED